MVSTKRAALIFDRRSYVAGLVGCDLVVGDALPQNVDGI